MPILRRESSNLEEDISAVSTQTESEEDSVDCVDSAIVPNQNRTISPAPNHTLVNGHTPSLERHNQLLTENGFGSSEDEMDHGDEGGFFSSLITRVLTSRKKPTCGSNSLNLDRRRTTSTQTEEQDPVTAKGQQLSYLVVQELALKRRTAYALRDDVFESLCSCVSEILEKHSILFNGMVRRIEVTHYHMFESVANELFEANANNETGQLRITWGRICSLFAFTVRLVQEYREDQDRVDSVTRYLASYMTKHVISFVRNNGGWDGLVAQFPPPDDSDSQFRKAVIWSGLCVGLVATMYVTSLLR